jgi:hypothetical protein
VTRFPRHAAATLATLVALSLAGCGGGDDTEGEKASGAATSSSKTSGGADDFCQQLKDGGANGASFGPVQAFLPKDGLLADIDRQLTPMADVTPPEEIAEHWDTQKAYLEELRAAAEALPADGRLSDPALISSDRAKPAYTALTDYWFDTCA